MTIENIDLAMFVFTIEQQYYPNDYIMKAEHWKNNVADITANLFYPLLDNYRQWFNWGELE